MNFFQAYKMAIKSILGSKVRTLLTMLGVIIGVASVIAAVAFAQGSTKSITDSLQSLGTNLIQINVMGRNSNRKVTYNDLKKFAEENSSEISAMAPQLSTNALAKSGTKNTSTTILGTSPEYEKIMSVHVQRGRFLLDNDIDNMQKVAVLGTFIASEVFEGKDPIGESIKLNGQVYKVVGILEEKANGAEDSDDDRIIIPITTAQRMSGTASIRNFSIQASTPEAVDKVMEKLKEFLLSTLKDARTFRIFNQADAIKTLDDVTGSMSVVLGGIAAISLIVGGIGIMNIMLVSVTERTREIGIRKAIGAKKKSILVQFLIEAVIVTGLGGLTGVLLGVSIIKFVIEGFDIAPAVYSMPWIIISFGISLIVGVVFGLFPAIRAANLNPIEALRSE